MGELTFVSRLSIRMASRWRPKRGQKQDKVSGLRRTSALARALTGSLAPDHVQEGVVAAAAGQGHQLLHVLAEEQTHELNLNSVIIFDGSAIPLEFWTS